VGSGVSLEGVSLEAANGTETSMGRGVLLWLLGIPLPVLLLLWAFGVLH